MSQPTLWGFDENERGGQVRATDPETSQRAAAGVRVGSYHAMVIGMLAKAYPEGLTARAVAEASIETGRWLTPEKASTRLKELHDRGFVEFLRDRSTQAPVEVATTPGNTGRVHVLNSRGYDLSVTLRIDERRLGQDS